MNILSFELFEKHFVALESGALWWPDQKLLCVSDLHLGKSERIARLGGTLLPPYECEETLNRLDRVLSEFSPKTVIALGDSFDDMDSAAGLRAEIKDRLIAAQAGRRWIWIAGNHDPAPIEIGGDHLLEFNCDALTFRHETSSETKREISGHFHPKARLKLRGRSYSAPCFLFDGDRLVLPAFGAYTGGLRTDEPVLTEIMQPNAEVILTGKLMARVPMPRANGQN